MINISYILCMRILAHTCFIGTTGYANHARSFFCSLNKFHEVKVRNLTIGNSWNGYNINPHDGESYMTEEMKGMLYQQTLYNPDGSRTDFPIYSYDKNFKPDVHIILMEMDQHYYYDEYDGYKIAFCVWESTRYPDHFFNQLMKFNEIWVPTQWQFDCLVEQGCPPEKIHVIPEGVDVDTFKPIEKYSPKEKFRFLHFGRWDYRKGTTEILRAFSEEFADDENVELIASVENPYPNDGLKSTEERVKFHNIDTKRIKFLNFLPREDYVKYLQEGDVFVSCSRSEGWNLPLCIPEDKLIYCNDTFVPIQDVKDNDIVITHNGNPNKVLKTFKRNVDSNIINIQLYNDFEPLELTKEHPVYVIKREKFITKHGKFKNIPLIKPEWIESKNIKKGDVIIRTTIPQKYFKNKKIDLLFLDNELLFDNEKVWYKNGYNQDGVLVKYNRYVYLWDLAFLFGWYIAEGTDGENKLIFSLNSNKEIPIADKIISEIFRVFGSRGSYEIYENKLYVKFNSKILCKFFTYFCGKMSYNKQIPYEILNGPINVLNEVIYNMVLGDGSLSNTKELYYYSTVSKILSRQLVFANQRLNVKTIIQIGKRKNRTDKRPCYNLTWSFNNKNGRHSNKSWWHPEGLGILVKNVKEVPYEGFVYNLEVENDNSFLLSNATVHNCEAMACGTPSIYSEWGGQLQFAEGKGLPVKIQGLIPANYEHKDWPGNYCEPDWNDLKFKMRQAYEYWSAIWVRTFMGEYKEIHENFNWEHIGKIASDRLEKINNDFVFVTTGNEGYMPVIQKLVESLLEFSNKKIIVYGVNCDVPFNYPNVIQRRIDVIQHSEHDKWYWKQQACITSTEEDFENFVWIDGDVVVNYNIDNIKQYFPMITDYPVPDIHVQDEFFGVYGEDKSQLFGEELAKELEVEKFTPYAHICMYVYNKKCKWWFERILKLYHETPLEDYKRLFLWNDEGIDNGLRWANNFRKFLPLSNFDTSSYDGDLGYTSQNLQQFYKFWNEDGPQNFGKIYGYQFIPKDKSQILYFHGNKDTKISDKMINFIKLMRDKSFYQSKFFYTDIYDVKNLGTIDNYVATTMEVANMVGWDYAIFHEIYNLQEYYHNRIRRINNGDIVVDLGGNIGIFNRWAYSQGASKVISFEPDKRYFKLLSLNADPKSILFNAAISDNMGEIELYESPHLGGSATHEFSDYLNKYKVRTYTLDYLFETGLIDRIDFLKIDIEGAEIEALNGISDENLKKVKTISMEYHNGALGYNDDLRTEFIERLRNNGFNSFLLFLGNDNNLQLIYFWK